MYKMKTINKDKTTAKTQNVLLIVLLIYIICFAFRLFEYFVLRTDKTWVGEAIVHKLLGIAVLFVSAKLLLFIPAEIGFAKEKAFTTILKGLAFGLCVFLVAYTVEVLLENSQGKFNSIQFYVSSYAIDQNIGHRTQVLFFFICIVGNIVNVVMEEGIFRGLFNKILRQKFNFIASAIIASVLFGFWHIVGPVRNYFDGTQSLNGMIANAVMLLFSSALVGFKFALLTKMTGSIYMGMGDHFVNNTIVNLLHVVSNTGSDEMMVIRISIAQSLSLILVLVWYIINRKKTSMGEKNEH